MFDLQPQLADDGTTSESVICLVAVSTVKIVKYSQCPKIEEKCIKT